MSSGDVANIANYGVWSETTPLQYTYGWLDFDASDSPVITDFCQRAFDNLAEQFKNSEDFKKLICSYVSEIQELEYVFQDLRLKRALSTAIGAQLDIIGEILDVTRDVLTDPDNDEEYRNRLELQTIVYRSNGEPEVLIQIVTDIANATFVEFVEDYPAKFNILTDGFSSDIARLLQIAKPAGVGFGIVTTFGRTPRFAFSLDGGGIKPGTSGYEDLGGGGKYNEKLTV